MLDPRIGRLDDAEWLHLRPFRDELAVPIKAMPEFRETLADSRFNIDHPVWLEDKDFDIDRHLHRIGRVRSSGTDAIHGWG